MITGDKLLSPNIKDDLKACTDSNNINGEFVKVILISMAGSEGLDFKFIRQINILEPWYNIHRTEQIIGRGVRTCSHKDLELKKRNVKIYLHGTLMSNISIESVDLLIYRKSEIKAKQIGIITKIMKEMSVDCNLNIELLKYSEENLKKVYEDGIELMLSNNEIVKYNIGDKSNTALCDYMETCSYNCKNKGRDLYSKDESILNTYNEDFMKLNNEIIVKKIKNLFIEKFFYTKLEIIQNLSIDEKISILAINNGLNEMINNKIMLKDRYNRNGYIINIDELYIYQPEELNKSNSSLYSKTVPLNLQTNKIQFNVPESIKTTKLKFDRQNIDKDLYTYRDNGPDYDNNLFTTINNIFNAIVNTNREEILKLSENKEVIYSLYELCSKIKTGEYKDINIYSTKNSGAIIDDKFFTQIIIHILLDSLDFKNHKELFEFVFKDEFMVYKNSEKDIYIIIKNYYENNIIYKEIDKNTRKIIIFPINIVASDVIKSDFNYLDKKLYQYCIFNIDNKNKLIPGKYLDYEEFKDIINDKFNIKIENNETKVINYGIILGTIKYSDNIIYSKKNNFIIKYDFRIKTLKDKFILNQYNDGRICTTSSKNDINNLCTDLELDEKNFVKSLKKLNLLCIGIEIFLRFYDIINKNNKRWF